MSRRLEPESSRDVCDCSHITYLQALTFDQTLTCPHIACHVPFQAEHERKAADLSSVVVDINKAAEASGDRLISLGDKSETTNKHAGRDGEQQFPIPPSTAPVGGGTKRPMLQHQTSLSASASAAVGAASEAGKFLANKFATEVNLKGAKEMVLAAANHLTSGGGPKSRIKFKNLPERDEDDDDDDDDGPLDEDDDEDDDDDGDTGAAPESTMDDEDEDSDFARKQRQKQRNKPRGQSVLSAAISSYKQKQRKGYKQALDDEFDEDDEDDDDVDEMKNLNRSASFKGKSSTSGGGGGGGGGSTKNKQASKKSSSDKSLQQNQRKQQAAYEAAVSSSTDDRQTPNLQLLDSGRSPAARRSTKSRRSQKRRSVAAGAGAGERGGSRRAIGVRKINGPYEEDDLESSGRTFRCLDNSVSLLIKNTFEETLLRIAVGGIVLVAMGIFILFSLPPTPPPKQVVDILIKN